MRELRLIKSWTLLRWLLVAPPHPRKRVMLVAIAHPPTTLATVLLRWVDWVAVTPLPHRVQTLRTMLVLLDFLHQVFRRAVEWVVHVATRPRKIRNRRPMVVCQVALSGFMTIPLTMR